MLFFFVPIVLPVLYYKIAVRTWLIESIGGKIILAIAIYASTMVLIPLSEYLFTLSFLIGLGETGTWIFTGCAYLIISWMLISFLAEKISNGQKKL